MTNIDKATQDILKVFRKMLEGLREGLQKDMDANSEILRSLVSTESLVKRTSVDVRAFESLVAANGANDKIRNKIDRLIKEL